MTTGNLIIDLRNPTTLAGKFYSRVWSGGDQSLGPPPEVEQPEYIEHAKKWRLEYKPLIPPKRDKNYDEHPYSTQLQVVNDPPQGPPYTNYSCFYLFGSNMWGPQGQANAWTANDDLKLIAKLRRKFVGSSFNAGLCISQLGKTFKMIGDTARKLALAIKAAKRGNFNQASRILVKADEWRPATSMDRDRITDAVLNTRDGLEWSAPRRRTKKQIVASNWLELQYGWLPLISDMQDGAKYLAHHLNTPLQTTYRVREQVEQTWVGSPECYPDNALNITRKQIIAHVVEKNQSFGLSTMVDIPSVVWELTPYSFVADAFLPINDWLEARTAAQTLQGTYVTTVTHRVQTSGRRWPGESPDFKALYLTCNRTIAQNLDVPLPRYIPLNEALSVKRCLNYAALLVNVLR